MEYIPDRKDAEELFLKYNSSKSLYYHARQVESVMRYFAETQGEDVEKWGIIGFLHDLDYEMYPDQHCEMTEKILTENNYPKDYIRAIISHGYTMRNDVKPESYMEKVLFTVDELTGLINAACLLRPSKSVLDLSLKSLKKKFKDKSFAQGVNREVIKKGAEMLEMDLDTVLTETIKGLQKYAEYAGLKGEL